jgi:Uma2 family endonuclease
MATIQRMTFEDLAALPDDENRHELVRGEIIGMPPPQGDHGHLEFRLARFIERHLDAVAQAAGWEVSQGEDERDLLAGMVAGGEAGVRFTLPDDPDQTRGMDLCYLSPDQAARYYAAGLEGYFQELPSLVAEVISPSEKAAYIEQKVADYLAGGARLVWLLFPTLRTVRVYRADGTTAVVTAEGTLSGESVISGFSVPVAHLFPARA